MYPETDIPPQRLTHEQWENVVNALPMSDAQRSERLSTYGMSVDQFEQLLARELDDLFCEHAAELPPKAWAASLLNHDTESPQTLANILTLREEGALLETMLRASSRLPWTRG